MKLFTKIFIRCVLSVGGFIVITLIYLSHYFSKYHEDEIHEVIAQYNGKVNSIEEIKSESSPFGNEIALDNSVFKISYEINDEQHVAWYRAVNTVINMHNNHSSQYGGGFGPKWFFQ